MVKGLWIEVATIATALAGPLTQGSHIFLSCFCGSNLQDQQVYSECIEAVACSLCVSTNSLYAFVKSLSCLSTLSVRSPRSSTCVWIWEIYPFRSFCIPFCRAMSIYVHVCSETALSEAGRSAKESVIFPPSSSSLYSSAAWYLRIFCIPMLCGLVSWRGKRLLFCSHRLYNPYDRRPHRQSAAGKHVRPKNKFAP